MRGSHSNPVQTAEQIAAVMRLKRDGMTVRQIAAELGLSPTTVQRRLDAGIEATVSPEVEELRVSETARLEALTKALAKGVRAGDVPSVAESRRIGESLRKLHGVDAPARTDVVITAQLEMSADVVSDVLFSVLPAVLAAAGLDTARMQQLERYGFELAQHALAQAAGNAAGGPPPQPPRPLLAITAGPAVHPPAAPPEPEPTAGPPGGLTPAERAELDDVLADAEQPRPPRPAKDDPPAKDDTSGWPPELRRRMSPMGRILDGL
jgi:AcrR family transcriptional regulator